MLWPYLQAQGDIDSNAEEAKEGVIVRGDCYIHETRGSVLLAFLTSGLRSARNLMKYARL